jgi:hypothetical protein
VNMRYQPQRVFNRARKPHQLMCLEFGNRKKVIDFMDDACNRRFP